MLLKQRIKQIVPAPLLDQRAKRRLMREYRKNYALSKSEYPTALKRWFEGVTGEELDLTNPRTFNQKIQWMKLYDSTPVKGRLADKYLVREYVAERIGEEYLVPLLGVWDDPDNIDFDSLPDRFVLKATHGCGWNIIVRDKSMLDVGEAKRKLREWLSLDYSMYPGLELHYGYCEPRIIAEEYLENADGDLYDYKFFCFGGRCESIMFLKDRKAGLRMAFFDRAWNKLPYVYSYPRIEEDVPKPQFIGDAMAMAETLSCGWPHVRVDFYMSGGGVFSSVK